MKPDHPLVCLERSIRAALRDPATKGAEIIAIERWRFDWADIAKEIRKLRRSTK